jgi:hypothetical protein
LREDYHKVIGRWCCSCSSVREQKKHRIVSCPTIDRCRGLMSALLLWIRCRRLAVHATNQPKDLPNLIRLLLRPFSSGSSPLYYNRLALLHTFFFFFCLLVPRILSSFSSQSCTSIVNRSHVRPPIVWNPVIRPSPNTTLCVFGIIFLFIKDQG